MEIITGFMELAERDPVSAIIIIVFAVVAVWFLSTRNQSNAIALAASIVATFHPVETAITKLVENITTLNNNTLQSHTLILSLGERLTTYQQEQNANHLVLLQRFDSCSAKLQSIIELLQNQTDLSEATQLNQELKNDINQLMELTKNGHYSTNRIIRRYFGVNPAHRVNVVNKALGVSRQTKGNSD